MQYFAARFVLQHLADPELGTQRLRVVEVLPFNPAGVESLPATGGIKSGAVEDERTAAVRQRADRQQRGDKIVKKRILVVQAFCHGILLWR